MLIDITLCAGHEGCQLKNKCRRFLLLDYGDKNTSYADFKHWRSGQECDFLLIAETREDILEAKREELNERRKQMFG